MTSPKIRVLLNIAWLIGERLARIAAGLAVGIVVARHLGPANFGQIAYIQAIVAVVATVAGLGLEPILMKELVAGKHPRHIAYSTAIGIASITSFSAMLAGFIYAIFFVHVPLLRTLFLIAFSCLPIQTLSIISVPLQAQEKFALLVRYQLVQIVVSVTLRFVLVWLDAGLAWFMAAVAVDGIVWLLLLLKLKMGEEPRFEPRHVRFTVAAELTAASAPLFATNLVVLLQIRIDQMLLGALATVSAVGNFSVASKLAEGLMMGPSIVIRALNPQLLKAKANSEDEFKSVLRRQFDFSVMIAALIAGGFCLGSGLLVRVLFGAQYRNAAAPLAVLVWAIVPMTIGSVSANAVIAQGQTKQTLAKASIGLGMNALLNYTLIPLLGAAGSALATLTSHICSAYLGMLLFRDQRFMFAYASRALLLPLTFYRYRSEFKVLLRRVK